MPNGRRTTRRTTRPQPGFAPFWLRQGAAQPAAAQPEIPVLAQIYNQGAAQRAPTHGAAGAPLGQVGTTQGRPNVPTAPPAVHYPPRGLWAGQGAQGAQGAEPVNPSFARYFGRWGYAMPHVLDPEQVAQDQAQQGRQYTPPGQTGAAGAPPAGGGGGGAGGGGGGGGGYAQAPAGVDPGWYGRFQQEHGGQTPEQFYAQTGEGLAHALADKEWSEGFARMYGRPPSEYDWRAHWFSTRAGGTPESRQSARSSYSRWVEQQRDKEREEQKPPTYMPPAVIWR